MAFWVANRGPGLGLWLVKTLLVSVLFLQSRLGDHSCWSKEEKDGSQTQGDLGDTREETWGVWGEADLSGGLFPHLVLRVTWLIRGGPGLQVALEGDSCLLGLSPAPL